MWGSSYCNEPEETRQTLWESMWTSFQAWWPIGHPVGPFTHEPLTLADIQIQSDTSCRNHCTGSNKTWATYSKCQRTGNLLSTHPKTEFQINNQTRTIRPRQTPPQAEALASAAVVLLAPSLLSLSFFSFCHVLHMVDEQAWHHSTARWQTDILSSLLAGYSFSSFFFCLLFKRRSLCSQLGQNSLDDLR